ncbi:hypothetical protein ACFWBN_29315 [Streptomyces sp. NPDC059989]|uniref:hypothetical protein n=1 Tax=Streptomyces sp. NPDC059989 TaxID=3347026 RepID=UPI0036CED603
MRKYVPATALALALALSACSGDKEPSASDSPPPGKAEIAYYDCLEDHGVAIVHTDSGALRVDKDKPLDKLPAAQKACEDKAPTPPSPEKADPKLLAAAQKEAACLRAEGVSWYPDPDPVTGRWPDFSPEQAAELRTKHIEAVRSCRQERNPGGQSVVGG